jgi:hypothetical protein
MKSYMRYKVLGGMAFSLVIAACTDLYDLPEDKDFISDNLTFSTKIIEPTLGRTSVFTPLNVDNSTLPMTFEIINPRFGDGRPATDFLQIASTYEWIAEYDGEETSLEEIESKRRLVDKPMFEVDAGGRFILYGSSSNELITP